MLKTRRRGSGIVLLRYSFCAGWAAALLFAALIIAPGNAAAGLEDECDTGLSYNAPADNLCVPGISTTTTYVIDGQKGAGEWLAGTYYDHNEFAGGGTSTAQVLVSHKKRTFTNTDLYLFFEVHGDAFSSFNDEIRIGLNSGTTPGNDTLIKIFPWSASGVRVEVYTFNAATTEWVLNSTNPAWFPTAGADKKFAAVADAISSTWTAEVKIPLELLPHPITGTDFRLYMELHADDNVNVIAYPWPPHGVAGAHNHICANPQRWHPMTFGTGCFADLSIANGLYSCDAVYVLRGGAKSTEIAVNQVNEFHADVTNLSGSKNAADVRVYMTLLQLGISTAPIAMNYDHTDATVKNWFQQKWGAWLFATDKLDSGSPKPPTAFGVNAGLTNTGARFNWKPSDETRFGDPNAMVGSHKCTAAFVDFKDDPNMANNFSYCNTTIVKCPTGTICPLSFWIGPYSAYAGAAGHQRERLKMSALNEPYRGWLENTTIRLAGRGVERVGKNVFEAALPKAGNLPLLMEFAVPDQKPDPRHTESMMMRRSASAGGDVKRQREEFLRRLYGDKPVVLVEGLMPDGYKNDLQGARVKLFRPGNYAAFALDTRTSGGPQPVCCGQVKMASFGLSALAVAVGFVGIRRRFVSRTRSDGTDRE